MLFIFIAAFIGLLVAGPLGFLVGGLVGYAAHVILRQSILGGLRVVQSELIDSTFAIMGALCKADKVVTRDEINAVEQIMTMLRLQGEQRQQARTAFNQGKQPDFDLDAAVDRFAQISRGRTPLLQLFLQLQKQPDMVHH